MSEQVAAVGDTLPEVSTVPAEDTQAGDNVLEVKFNKQTHTLSREDATRYAQLGMKYDSVEPLLGTLKELAARDGVSLSQYVETLAERPTPTPQDALAERLAAEYAVLCREVPQIGGFDTLPSEVVREAAADGIPLLDAYLRHENRERCRIEAERAAAAAAAAAATGRMGSAPAPTAGAVESAMLRGVWGVRP